MFASLLTRLLLYNGPGLWRSLLEESGYGRRTISQFFGPPMQDAKLDRLLVALGYDYPTMLHELTVLPFWLAFNRAAATRFRIKVGGAGNKLTGLTTLGHSHFLPGARYCPACLREDIEVYGEPYVHRPHQIPVALVCSRHGAALRFSCPACGVTVLPFNRALLRPPALRCQCGQDLSHTSEPPPHQPALLRLSQFGADALSCTEAPWSLDQVLAVLQERVGVTRKNFKRSAMQLLQETYGVPDEGHAKARTVLRWTIEGSPLRLKIASGIWDLRAPEFCALLAATKLTFEEFRKAVTQVEIAAPTRRTETPDRPITQQQARMEFEQFERQSPGRAATLLQRSSVRLFWLLRFRDGAWLRARGYPFNRPATTVEADRTRIDHLLQQHGLAAKSSLAWIRADIRDHVWLKARIQAHLLQASNRETRAQRLQRDRAVALSRAVFSLLKTQARPARVHAGLLAKFVQISMHQAQHTIANTPALQTLLAAVNAGKDRRLAFWAARSLIEAGEFPSSQDVLLRAGLNTTRVNRQFCIDAITRFATAHGAIGDPPSTRKRR